MIKTIEAEISLMRYFDIRQNIIVPNVTSLSGVIRFEADLLIVNKSGYATVVEIKVSKSDLKKDVNKYHIENLERNYEHNGKPIKDFMYENIKS